MQDVELLVLYKISTHKFLEPTAPMTPTQWRAKYL